jgi:hypothetical protein
MKSGLEKIFLKLLHVQYEIIKNIFYFLERRIFAKFTNSVTKLTIFVHEGISKNPFVVYVLIVNETLRQSFIHIPFSPGKRWLNNRL